MTAAERPSCPLCGGELRPSHREYAGRGRSLPVLRCTRCGNVVRGDARPDVEKSRPPSRRRRPLPAEGQPDNFVLDAQTGALLRRALGPDSAASDE
jgi:hypothetical protein